MPLDDHGALDGIEEGLSTKFNQDFSVPVRAETRHIKGTKLPEPPSGWAPGQIVEMTMEDMKSRERIGQMAQIPVLKRDPIKVNGYSLIPPEPLGELARVYQIGADKHGSRSWEAGMPFSEIVDKLYRHAGRWSRGEKFDLEDGQHNMASVAWMAFAIMELEKTHPELDDVHGA